MEVTPPFTEGTASLSLTEVKNTLHRGDLTLYEMIPALQDGEKGKNHPFQK